MVQSTLLRFSSQNGPSGNFDIFEFCVFMMHFCRLLEIIVLGSPDTRIHQFRMTFKLPCGTLTSQIYYQNVVNYLRNASRRNVKVTGTPWKAAGFLEASLSDPRHARWGFLFFAALPQALTREHGTATSFSITELSKGASI